MNPDLEVFLQDILGSLERGSSPVPRVAVEPDYESGSTNVNAEKLCFELLGLIAAQVVDPRELASHEGIEVPIPNQCVELSKGVRRIFLHGDREEGPWIEVIPPGNWI
jgi:hypothetical protein